MYSETKHVGMEESARRQAGMMLGASVFLMLAHIAADVVLGHGRVSTILVLLYGIPASHAGSALYIAFRRHDPVLTLVSAFCFAGHGLLMVLTAAILLAGLQFPAEFALYGAEPSSLGGAASLPELTMDKIGKSSFLLLGLGLSLIGSVVLLSCAAPIWIGWLGMIVGIGGFLVSLAGLTDIFARGTTELLMGAVILACMAFMLVLGFRLASHEVQEAPNSQAAKA